MNRDDIADPRRPAPVSDRLARVNDEGVLFRHPVDGRLDLFNPEVSIRAQFHLGADILMAFDELTSIGDSYEYNVQALERTERWAVRSLEVLRTLQAENRVSRWLSSVETTKQSFQSAADTIGRVASSESVGRVLLGAPAGGVGAYQDHGAAEKPYQALYGILQGAHYQDLRRSTAHTLGEMDFDGYGLGGAFEKEQLGDILFWTNTILPNEKPRHLLGLARPDDIFVGVSMGIDTFDCVSPTREARHGRLYTADGYKNIMRSRFIDDPNPIEPGCDCPTCDRWLSLSDDRWLSSSDDRWLSSSDDRWLSSSKLPITDPSKPPSTDPSKPPITPTHVPIGTLRALLKSHIQEERRLGYQLTSAHNVRFILRLMEEIRASIIEGTFHEFRKEWLNRYYAGNINTEPA